MVPILLHLGPLTIYSYGLMMALAFLAGDLVVASEFHRRGYNPEHASTLILWIALLSIAGARLYDVIDNWPVYMQDPKSIVLSGSGFVFYGGFMGGVLATYLFSRRYNIPWLRLFDMCAPAVLMGQAIGRVGCQLAGDGDWGMPSTLPWAMAYPNAIVGWNGQTVLRLDSHNNLVSAFYPGVRVHPAPIYETILYLACFALLWSIRKKNTVDGRMFYLYLVLAGASRFLVEFIRVNPRVLWVFSEAQVISLVMIAAGLICLGAVALQQSGIAARGVVRA